MNELRHPACRLGPTELPEILFDLSNQPILLRAINKDAPQRTDDDNAQRAPEYGALDQQCRSHPLSPLYSSDSK